MKACLMHITNENLDCTIITMFIHNLCNFSCSYCSDFHRNGEFRWPQDWTPYVNLIKKQQTRSKYIHIEILGGEPTLWPAFHEFINVISDENVFVEWGTNGSRTLRYWEQLNENRSFVSFSWHSEYADDDHYYKVVELMQHKASVNCTLMVLPTNFDRAVALYEKLKSLNVEITPRFTRVNIHETTLFDYTDEQRDWIKSAYYNKMKPFGVSWQLPKNLHFDGQKVKFTDVVDKKMNKFLGYKCNAGIKRLYIAPDGRIKRCSKNVGGWLGNILTSDYTLPDTPVICDREFCNCKLDAIIEKEDTHAHNK
jgi:organic radical activating enzyme